jgi:hypothetical protein
VEEAVLFALLERGVALLAIFGLVAAMSLRVGKEWNLHR